VGGDGIPKVATTASEDLTGRGMGGAVEGLWEEEDEGRPGGHDAWDSSWTRGPDARVKAVRQCET
jgi:hypothetical protein